MSKWITRDDPGDPVQVERKLLRQWFLKITDAEELLNDLDQLT